MAAQADNRFAHEEAHGHTEPTPHHAVPYVIIFWVLVFLTVLTVGVWYFPFERPAVNLLIALAVATAKATFVASYFMHLKFEGKLIWMILIVPVILTIILIFALIPDIVHGTAFNPMVPQPGVEDIVAD